MNSPTVRYARPLAVSRSLLRALVKLNLVYGFLILTLLAATLVAPGPVMYALGVRPAPKP